VSRLDAAQGGGLQVTSRLLRGNIAYLKLPGFFHGSADQTLAAIARLRKTVTLRGVILDLRGNSGGDAAEVATLLGAWIHGKALNCFCDIRGHCTCARRDLAILGRLRMLRSLRILQITARMIEEDGDVCQVRWRDQAR
jgi:hypothetical protein